MTIYLVYLLGSLSLVGAYLLLALGITVIYQASRVLNLAHGAMATSGAYATYQLSRWHLPILVAMLGGVAAGMGLGLLVERIVVRRLRPSGPTAQTVGTVAILIISIAVVSRLFGTVAISAPQVIPSGHISVGTGFVAYNAVGIFPVAAIAAVLLFSLLRFTDMGLAMRGAAQNRRAAALRGVNPDRTSALAWMIGGGLAALAGLLIAAETELDPFTVSLGVLPAFVAALIGGLESLPAVCIGAVLIGVIQGMVPAFGSAPVIGGIAQEPGAPELTLGLLALVVMATRGARLSGADVRGDTL